MRRERSQNRDPQHGGGRTKTIVAQASSLHGADKRRKMFKLTKAGKDAGATKNGEK